MLAQLCKGREPPGESRTVRIVELVMLCNQDIQQTNQHTSDLCLINNDRADDVRLRMCVGHFTSLQDQKVGLKFQLDGDINF